MERSNSTAILFEPVFLSHGPVLLRLCWIAPVSTFLCIFCLLCTSCSVGHEIWDAREGGETAMSASGSVSCMGRAFSVLCNTKHKYELNYLHWLVDILQSFCSIESYCTSQGHSSCPTEPTVLRCFCVELLLFRHLCISLYSICYIMPILQNDHY
jgi:hypothetical protein